MSNRANGGMMAVVGQHKSMVDLEQSLMIKGDPAAPNAAAAVTDQVAEAPQNRSLSPVATGKRRKAPAPAPTNHSRPWDHAPVDEIAAAFVPETQMRVLHTRIPHWLDEALKDKLGPLARENSKITKQALITFALIKALGVTPPDDFRLY